MLKQTAAEIEPDNRDMFCVRSRLSNQLNIANILHARDYIQIEGYWRYFSFVHVATVLLIGPIDSQIYSSYGISLCSRFIATSLYLEYSNDTFPDTGYLELVQPPAANVLASFSLRDAMRYRLGLCTRWVCASNAPKMRELNGLAMCALFVGACVCVHLSISARTHWIGFGA